MTDKPSEGIPQRDQLTEEDRQFVVEKLAEMLWLDYQASLGASPSKQPTGKRGKP